MAEAHPRSRGENASRDAHNSEPTGSSPLTRGKLVRRLLRRERHRLIPAHAGKTSDRRRCPCRGAAHPRSRGENISVKNPASVSIGSSPLTRGKHQVVLVPLWRNRLIPAHAGKTSYQGGGLALASAHPRSRGENRAARHDGADRRGLSPLTRGKRWYVRPRPRTAGLIPAHAGKT